MQATLNRTTLHRALSLVERATARNAALPILSNVLLSVADGKCSLAATNLEIGVHADIGAQVGVAGKIAVPGRILSELIRAADADTVKLSLKQGVLSVEAGSYKTSILCLDAGEYPIIPTIVGGVALTLPAREVKQAFEGVIDSIATSDARPELAGAYLSVVDGTLSIAATDSFRLAERRITTTAQQSLSAIIPRAAIAEVAHAITDNTDEITLRVADNQIAFSLPDAEIISRLIDGRYPEYRKVIPERSLSRVLVRSADLENAIRVIALFSSSISDVHLSCTAKKLTLSAKNATRGEGVADVEAHLKGEPFDLSMNHHYLLDGLKVAGADKVVLEFTGKGSPFVVRPSEGQDAVYIIMPLRG